VFNLLKVRVVGLHVARGLMKETGIKRERAHDRANALWALGRRADSASNGVAKAMHLVDGIV
jgi:hypothetical protein